MEASWQLLEATPRTEFAEGTAADHILSFPLDAVTGDAFWRSGARRVPVRVAPGQTSLIPAGLTHGGRVVSPGRILLLRVAAGRLNGEFGGALLDACDPVLARLRDAYLAGCAAGMASQTLFADAVAEAMIARVSCWTDAAPAARGEDPPALARAREFIHAHSGENLSLAQVAAAAGVGPARVRALFARHLGEGPWSYLTRVRVERAVELLAGSRLPVSQVALACGFCDQSHLNRLLRRHRGTTPGALRESSMRSVQDGASASG